MSSPPTRSEVEKSIQSQKAAQGSTVPQATRPRVRVQTMPTESQRAAFKRALASRNAERAAVAQGASGKGKRATESVDTPLNTGRLRAGQPRVRDPSHVIARSPLQSKSLSELARMAVNKRPLAAPNLNRSGARRAAFAVGFGLAGVIVLGILAFELLRPRTAEVVRPTQTANPQLFSPRPTLVENSAPPPPTSAPLQRPVLPGPPSSQPPTQFNPNPAPPNPPPPEYPEPTEPPMRIDPRYVRFSPPLNMSTPEFQPKPNTQQ